MAKLSRDDVLKLARLARLSLSDQEIERFEKELSQTLDLVAQLQDADLGDVEPTFQVSGQQDVMRPDEIRDYGMTPEDLLKNAPAVEGDYIKVKRMLG